MDQREANEEVQRLQERHASRLLDHLGVTDTKIRKDVKRAFNWFGEDIQANVIPKMSREKGRDTHGQGNTTN